MDLARRLAARIGRRSRLAAVGACLLLALGSALGAARHPKPTPPPTVPVVVAARALPAGHVLAARDLRIARWPPGLRPAGAAGDTRQLVREMLVGPIAAREAVTPGRLLGPHLTAGLAPGTAAVPVTLGVDEGGLVRAGDRIDLIAITVASPDLAAPASRDPTPPSVVATGVRVLACSRVLGPDGAPATRLVLATDRTVAVRIAGSLGTKSFAAVANHP